MTNFLYAGVQALLVSDFGPKTALKIVDSLRKDILAGKLKSGAEFKVWPISPLSLQDSELTVQGLGRAFLLQKNSCQLFLLEWNL